MSRGRVFVIDDEPNMGKILRKHLMMEDFEAEAFESPVEAVEAVRRKPPHVVVTDLRMPAMTGEQLLESVKDIAPGCQVVIMTAYGTIESAMRCVRAGAFDYVTKPFDTKVLLATIRHAMDRAEAEPQPPADGGKLKEGDWELLGDSPEMQQVRDLIRRIAPADSAVLIQGESGTGKELAARAIHHHSRRRANRFQAINCASIPESLMESELFGHVRGSFTGAHEDKVGLVEASSGGSLFLDEIGELPLGLQAKLLRVLQEREITRVGAVENRPVDIRVIAATNRRLEESVQAGHFREDLYYRLNVIRIKMPSLRSRREDIPLLVGAFLDEFARTMGRGELRVHDDVMAQLTARDWPGNVRELRNFVERLVVLSDGEEIGTQTMEELAVFDSKAMRAPGSHKEFTPSTDDGDVEDYRKARDQFEADFLTAALRACEGSVTEAAKKTGISRRSFYEKIDKLGIDPGTFKGDGPT